MLITFNINSVFVQYVYNNFRPYKITLNKLVQKYLSNKLKMLNFINLNEKQNLLEQKVAKGKHLQGCMVSI